MATGRSIHIGLNSVDPNAYNGWNGALSGCINDARDMKSIADGLGYQSLLLTDAAATSARVVSEIGQAAASLTTGDILFLTYSGHGGQVQDVNGDEDDALDETWVLWDRQLIDDELFSLWSQFAPDVRITMLSDSCHSGTVLRMLATYRDLLNELGRTKAVPTDAQLSVLDSLSTALDLGNGSFRAVPATAPKKSKLRAMTPAAADVSGPAATVLEHAATAAAPASGVKTVPPDVRDLVNMARADQDATLQWIAGPSEKANVAASVILISGCQDSQVSMDGTANGLFTEKLKAAWNSGSFSGDYRAFWTDIVSRMPASQKPNYATTGAPNPGFEAERPFTIGDGTPAPTPGHPTLQLGSKGPDVSRLQQKLVDAGYSLLVDADFGPGTKGVVEQFQADNGLDVDGVVGPATWAALDSAVTPGPEPETGPEPENGPGLTPTPSTRPTIRQGASGPDVEYLQERLGAWDYNIGVDGNFGPMTASAVRSFQSSNGLTVDGVVGPTTWETLG